MEQGKAVVNLADTGNPLNGQHCSVCGTEIKTMCFKGTDVCCENCRKVHNGERRQDENSSILRDVGIAQRHTR